MSRQNSLYEESLVVYKETRESVITLGSTTQGLLGKYLYSLRLNSEIDLDLCWKLNGQYIWITADRDMYVCIDSQIELSFIDYNL